MVTADFAETTRGVNERYEFSGEARNDGDSTRRLLMRARANGLTISGSQQSFPLAPGSNSFIYDFTFVGHPSPDTVGLEFEAPDGTITFVAGVFHAAPVPSVPANGPVTLGVLAAGLLLMGGSLTRKARAGGEG